MGLLDSAKDKMSDSDGIRKRIEELKNHEQNGSLSDAGREELTQLRSKLGK